MTTNVVTVAIKNELKHAVQHGRQQEKGTMVSISNACRNDLESSMMLKTFKNDIRKGEVKIKLTYTQYYINLLKRTGYLCNPCFNIQQNWRVRVTIVVVLKQ